MKLVHISAAISLDGFLDDSRPERLLLSSPEDISDMYAARAECDAILIGAETVRKDNPSLMFRDPTLVQQRVARGQDAELTKITLTRSGNLDPNSRFFTTGSQNKIVLCPPASVRTLQHLTNVAELLAVDNLDPNSILDALSARGIQKLFVEGGRAVLTAFLSSGAFDQLRLAIAPFFVGDAAAPRFLDPGEFLHGKDSRLELTRVRALGDVAVLDLRNRNAAIAR